MTAAANVSPITPTIKRVETFQTPDGTYFTSEQEALVHLAKAKFNERIDAYIASKGEQPKGTAGRARNIIADFLAWEESQK